MFTGKTVNSDKMISYDTTLFNVIQHLLNENIELKFKLNELTQHRNQDFSIDGARGKNFKVATPKERKLVGKTPDLHHTSHFLHRTRKPEATKSFAVDEDKNRTSEEPEALSQQEYKSFRKLKPCKFCQERHIWGIHYCPAYGKICNRCTKKNHSETACWSRLPKLQKSRSLPFRNEKVFGDIRKTEDT